MASKPTLADLFDCEDGTVLVAKDAVDGSLRHISEVANGLRCGCVCIGCGRELIARNGSDSGLRIHSFAHRPDEVTPNCATAGETALHMLGKEIIARHRRVTIPETTILGLNSKPHVVTPRRSISLTSVQLEVSEGEIVPDIVAMTSDGRRLFIEIKNTHECPPEKRQKLAAMDVDVLEIDVSGYRSRPLHDLDEIVLDLAPRKVLQSHALKFAAARRAAKLKEREAARRSDGVRRVTAYNAAPDVHSKRAAQLVNDMIALGLAEHMDLDDRLPSAFVVPRRQWQSAILYWLKETRYPDVLSAVDILKRLRLREWPKPSLSAMKNEDTLWIRDNIDLGFRSAYIEVVDYLSRLRRASFVDEQRGDRFRLSPTARKLINEAQARIARPAERKDEAEAALQAIHDLMIPEDGEWVTFDDWIKGRARNLGTTVDNLLQDDDSRFEDLIDTLEEIRSSIVKFRGSWQDDPPDDLVGLPLEDLFLRLTIEKREAQERGERARAERLKREAEARVAKIEETAMWEVSNVGMWMATPLPEHDGKTPRELALESAESARKVQAVISKMRDENAMRRQAEALRERMVGRLYEEARRRIPLEEKANLWVKQFWPDLDGKRPVDYCKDEKTLARCLEVMDQFVMSEQRRRRR